MTRARGMGTSLVATTATMTARPVPRRHGRSYANDSLLTVAEALEPFVLMIRPPQLEAPSDTAAGTSPSPALGRRGAARRRHRGSEQQTPKRMPVLAGALPRGVPF
jgi:hypothetical protein